MNQIVTLEVNYNYNNIPSSIYPIILKDDDEMILIDCGHPHFFSRIRKSAEANGVDLSRLTKIVITHHDYDHMGALSEFKHAYPDLLVVSSEIEEKYINGKEKSLRLQQAEKIYDSLPDSEKKDAKRFHRLLELVNSVDVDLVVKDHDVFPWCGGTEIISTPGHMPGHISLYVQKFKTLITGDALVVEDDTIAIPNPNYTLDIDEAKSSIKKLLDYDIEKIICYHGGIYTNNIKDSLKKILICR